MRSTKTDISTHLMPVEKHTSIFIRDLCSGNGSDHLQLITFVIYAQCGENSANLGEQTSVNLILCPLSSCSSSMRCGVISVG